MAARLALVALATVPVLASAESAFAVPWLSDDQSTQRSGAFTSKQAPSLASDPGNGQYVVAVGDGGTASGPKTALSYSSNGGVTWHPEPVAMPHAAGSFSGGSPSVAWLASSDDAPSAPTAVVAERGNGASACHAQGGIYLGTYGLGPSSGSWINGNAEVVAADVPASFTISTSPAVAAYDPAGTASDRIHVVYVRSTWANGPSCGNFGLPHASAIWLASSADGGTSWAQSQVSPIADQAITPALDVRSNGNLVVVWNDLAQNAVRSRICSGQNGCGEGFSPPAVLIDDSAVGASLASGHAVTAAPDVAVVRDVGERIVVAWSELGPTSGLDVMTRTSHDGGVNFTTPVRANDDPTVTDQFGASLAASARGQVELAFLDGRSGSLLPMASASRTPASAGVGEAWSSNVTLSGVPVNPAAGAPANTPQLSPHPVAVTSLAWDVELAGELFPTPRYALTAWTDTGGGGARDIHAVVLRHGSTTPTLSAANLTVGNFKVGKGDLGALQLTIVDPDGDPVTTRVSEGPGASVPNENLPIVSYAAPPKTEIRWVKLSLSDRTNVSSVFSVPVDVFNRPPVFECSANQAVKQNALLPIGACAKDPDPDTIIYSAESSAPGSVVKDSSGWYFQPHTGYSGKSPPFKLFAFDGEATAALEVNLDVLSVPDPPKFDIKASSPQAVRGSTLIFTATASHRSASNVVWNFGGSTSKQGAEVRHRFTKAGTYPILATLGGETRRLEIRITAPPLEITSLKWAGGSLRVKVHIGVPGKLTAKIGATGLTLQAKKAGTTAVKLRPLRSRKRALGHVLLVVTLTPMAKSANGTAGLKITRLVPVPRR